MAKETKAKPATKYATNTPTQPANEELAITKQANTLITQATAFVVRDKETCEDAIAVRENIKAARKKWKELLGPILDAAKNTLDIAREKFNKVENPLKNADDILKDKLKVYVDGEERKQREERMRLEREAREKAEREAEEKRLAQIERLTERGDLDAAAELVDAPLDVEPVKVEKPVNESLPDAVDHRFLRFKWIGKVVDMKKLVDAVSKGEVPIQALEPNQSFLNTQAKVFKDTDAMNYPGVEVVKE